MNRHYKYEGTRADDKAKLEHVRDTTTDYETKMRCIKTIMKIDAGQVRQPNDFAPWGRYE